MSADFIGSQMEGVETIQVVPAATPGSYKTKPHTPQQPNDYTTDENAKEPTFGTREFVTVKYGEVPSGATFFREYKKDHFMPFVKPAGDKHFFAQDYIVWVFRKKEAA